jgi:hypothetical protein
MLAWGFDVNFRTITDKYSSYLGKKFPDTAFSCVRI